MVTFNAKLSVWLQEGVSFALTRYLLVFVQGAREGLDIEARYHALSRKSRRALAKLNLTRGSYSSRTFEKASIAAAPPL